MVAGIILENNTQWKFVSLIKNKMEYKFHLVYNLEIKNLFTLEHTHERAF
jgi:hypothetical protein